MPRPTLHRQNDWERASGHLAENLSWPQQPGPLWESPQPVLFPLSLPLTRSHFKWPPSVALAWPGLSVLPPAGGEGQSLQQQQQLGLWVIAGFLTFLALEKMFLDSKEKEGASQVSPTPRGLDGSASVWWWPGP